MHYFEIESEKMHRPFNVADIKNKKLAWKQQKVAVH